MRNFRKRKADEEENDHGHESEDEEERRLALEEVKLLQKQREKKCGIPANQTSRPSGDVLPKVRDKVEGDGEKEELVLQDTFAQETAVMVEDPNMLKYIDKELAKKRGKDVTATNQEESDLKRAEDELYKVPDHLQVKGRNSGEGSTQWTTGIAEIQLPIEYKLKNIEETEAAKKLLHEKKLMGKTKTDSNLPSSHSADYLQRGKDYAEKLRRDHPELYNRGGDNNNNNPVSRFTDHTVDPPGRRQAATDEIILDRFRKRERQRNMRR